MSMVQVTGQLINVFKAPIRQGAADGEQEKDKLQILGEVLLKNGQTRMDLMTIGVPDARKYEGKEGEVVTVGVGTFAPQKGTVIYFGTAG